MKTEILRNIFISVGVLFTSAQLLSAGMNDGVLNFSKTPSAPPTAAHFYHVRSTGRPCQGHAAERHQPGRGHHRNLLRRERGRSRLPADSRRHLHHVQSPGLHGHLSPSPSTRRARSPGSTLTQASCLTVSCAPRTAPSPRSIRRAPHPHSPPPSTRVASSRRVSRCKRRCARVRADPVSQSVAYKTEDIFPTLRP